MNPKGGEESHRLKVRGGFRIRLSEKGPTWERVPVIVPRIGSRRASCDE